MPSLNSLCCFGANWLATSVFRRLSTKGLSRFFIRSASFPSESESYRGTDIEWETTSWSSLDKFRFRRSAHDPVHSIYSHTPSCKMMTAVTAEVSSTDWQDASGNWSTKYESVQVRIHSTSKTSQWPPQANIVILYSESASQCVQKTLTDFSKLSSAWMSHYASG